MKKTLLLLSFITLFVAASAQITSTFDTDADGWTFVESPAPLINHSASGGNPGGYVSVNYNAFVATNFSLVELWTAPAKFLGNHVVRSLDMNLRFDLQASHTGTPSDINGDVVITRANNSAGRIVLTLPAKPALAPAWTSYSLKLDETQGWRMGNSTGALATRDQIIEILTNVTAIQIRGTYATNASYISGLDNVILEQKVLAIAPVVSTISATSGKPGDPITINGNGFNTTPTNNVVSFGIGGVKAVVQSATATQLTIVVPQNASYGPIVITNTATGLSARTAPFNPVFAGGGRIIPASFKPKLDIPTILIETISAADIDGDGWIDLAVTNDFSDRVIDIYRNLGTGGTLSAASFDAKVSVAYTGVSSNGSGLWFTDLDGDGKLDAVTSTSSGGIGRYVTFRNTSIPGSISFETPEYWRGGTDESPISFIGDLDGDGRPEMMSGEGAIPGGFWFNQNISTPGNIEFGSWVAPFSLAVINGFTQANAADLDGDGKPELIITNGQGQAIDVLQNISTPGAPAFTPAFQFSTNQYTNAPVLVADMNLDGKNDLLYKTSGEVGFHIRLNADTDGILTAADFAVDLIFIGDLSGQGGISIADMNGDGKPDIVASDNTDFGVFENVFSGGVFDLNSLVPAYQYEAPGLNTFPTQPIAVDLNGDGKPEIFAGITNAAGPDVFTIYENVNIVAPVISLNTVSPLAGPVSSTVTITGSNFSTVTTENIVWFGSVRAPVLTATANQLTVTVPPGAAYAPVSVTKAELTSTYHLPFQTSFSSGVTFDNTHFALPVEFTLTNADYDIVVADLDNNGLPDVVAEGTPLTGLTSLFRNTHTAGPISTTSLSLNGTLNSAHSPRLEDLDGDGLIDVMSARGGVFKNNSTTGNISFQTRVPIANVDGQLPAFADFNRDGKNEIVVTAGSLSVTLVENRAANLTGNFTTGTFSTFTPGVAVPRPGNNGTLVTGDFDNDGFKDMITTNPFLDNISIYRNAQRPRANATSFAANVQLAVGDNPQFIYTADFDLDGKLDVLIPHFTGTTSTLLILLHNTSTVGTISFNRIDLINPSATTTATIADLDGDGKPEIITTSETGNRFSIFKNLHTTGALTAASFAAPFNTTVTAPRGVTTGDLNLDGKPEIILTRAAGFLVVYENLVSTTQNFITQWNLATTGSGATQLTFGTATSGTVNYAWQEISPGTASGGGSWSGSTLTITGLPTGATIRLQIAPTNFQRIVINNGADRNRLTQVEQWGNTAWTSMESAFLGCTNLQVTATDVPNLSAVTNMRLMFSFCTNLNSPSNINTWNTSNVNNMIETFNGARAFNQDIGAWNTAAVTNMQGMFFQTDAFNQDIGTWNTAAVTDMSNMFGLTDAFNQNIGAWNTSAVTRMLSMFENAIAFNQNIGSWNTAAVTTMKDMFQGAVVFNQNIGSWNTAAVTSIEFMFNGASAFNQNIGAWNTGAVIDMEGMFLNASAFNQNIGTWNTTAVIDMRNMFDNATVFNQNIGAWSLNPAVNLTGMFNNSGLDCANYSATLIGWSANPSTPNGRSLGANGRQYGTNAVAARTNLDITKSWTITGDTPSGVVCGSVAAPTITSFTPTSGPIGTTVTITGTNFSTTPANNTVAFNGTTAVVTASTSTSITTTVPTGATTGKISVTVGGNIATSTNDYTVTTVANQPPVIQPTVAAAPIDGIVTIDLLPLISDPDNNLDASTLSLVSSITDEGASAVLVGATQLELNYGSVVFAGTDRISISVCDLLSACTEQELSIEVSGEIKIFNAVSPNGDDKNPYFRIENIAALEPNNTVTIYNRWGSKVFEVENYAESNAFRGLNQNGNELPSGTYFYKIIFNSSAKTQTGYLVLKR